MTRRHGCEDKDVGHYTCRRTSEKIVVDGRLSEGVWQRAPKSPRFVDMVTGVPGLSTRMAALWDDENLYIGFWVEEPDVQAHLTQRDSPIYFENDVEVFIAGPDCYYEFEINARGTIYEVFYIWQDAYKKGGAFDKPEFDLLARTVDILGGFQDGLRYGKHPRGRRWAFMDWDFPGLQSAVHVDGKLNDSATVDRGWTVELAFPWSGMNAGRAAACLPGRRHLADGFRVSRPCQRPPDRPIRSAGRSTRTASTIPTSPSASRMSTSLRRPYSVALTFSALARASRTAMIRRLSPSALSPCCLPQKSSSRNAVKGPHENRRCTVSGRLVHGFCCCVVGDCVSCRS